MAGNTNFFATSDETESRFYRFLDLIAKGGVYKSADKDFHPFKGTSYQEKTKQAHFLWMPYRRNHCTNFPMVALSY